MVPDITINPRGIRPIRFHCDDVETVIADQKPRNGGAGPIEFAGAVGRFAQQHQAGIAIAGERAPKASACSGGGRSSAAAAKRPTYCGRNLPVPEFCQVWAIAIVPAQAICWHFCRQQPHDIRIADLSEILVKMPDRAEWLRQWPDKRSCRRRPGKLSMRPARRHRHSHDQNFWVHAACRLQRRPHGVTGRQARHRPRWRRGLAGTAVAGRRNRISAAARSRRFRGRRAESNCLALVPVSRINF